MKKLKIVLFRTLLAICVFVALFCIFFVVCIFLFPTLGIAKYASAPFIGLRICIFSAALASFLGTLAAYWIWIRHVGGNDWGLAKMYQPNWKRNIVIEVIVLNLIMLGAFALVLFSGNY